MKTSSLFSVGLLLTLGILASWTVEGSRNDAIKAGTCPLIKPAMCLRYEEPKCRNDWQCLGRKKCCHGHCGIKCLDPVAIVNPVERKAGRCPVVHAECLMLNPPNHCETDGQCDSDYKCCKGMCGKVCVPPV